MRDIEYYLEEGRLEEVSEDPGLARGFIKRSNRRLNNEKQKDVNDSNAFQILENTYEAIREIIEAWMIFEGYEAEDHVATIAWARDRLGLDRSTANKLHKFRKLRNDSRYEAKEISPQQAEEIVDFADIFIDEYTAKLKEELD